MGKFFSLLYFNNKINAQDEWSYTGNCGNWKNINFNLMFIITKIISSKNFGKF